MARSPIEMMIDKVCGVTPEDLARTKREIRAVDSDTQALMNVADAAVAWLKLRDNSTQEKYVKAELALVEATKVLAATGW